MVETATQEDIQDAVDEVHVCEEVITLQTTVAQLKAEVQLLQLGCRFQHIANNTDLVCSNYRQSSKLMFYVNSKTFQSVEQRFRVMLSLYSRQDCTKIARRYSVLTQLQPQR